MTPEKPVFPWWMNGMMLLMIALPLVFAESLPAALWVFYGPLIVGYAAFFIHSFVKQRPQYSLRSIFVLTICVAILCSLHSYVGKGIVLFICLIYFAMIVYTIVKSTADK